MIPLKDTTPRRSFPIITLLLIAANVVVFIHQIMLPPHAQELFIKTYAFTPRNLQLALQGHRYMLQESLIPLFTSMFLHGGFMHILGNMLFLWIFGGNVEDRMGPVGYLFFYLICGLGSGIAQTAFSWGSNVPSLGASGASPACSEPTSYSSQARAFSRSFRCSSSFSLLVFPHGSLSAFGFSRNFSAESARSTLQERQMPVELPGGPTSADSCSAW